MTRIEALEALADKVEAGDENRFAHSFLDEVRSWRSPLEYFEITNLVHRAYHGSLDAAKDLHEAVLPRWETWDKSHSYFGYEVALRNGTLDASGCSKVSEARAWLLAIIKALIADGRSDALQDLADADRDLI